MTRRPWTAEDQAVAEVAAACGVTYREIGKALGREYSVVRRHLAPTAREKARESNRLWRSANPDYMRDWYQSNRDRHLELCRNYRKANREKVVQACREYRRANHEKELQRSRRYRKVNHEKELQRCRYWRESNPEKMQHICREWRKSNPRKVQESRRRRDAWKRAGRRRALLPVTPPQIELRRAPWRHRCAFCGVDAKHPRNHGLERLTIEHVLALTKQGLDEAGNLMPACMTCKSSKLNAHVETWYRRQPFFTEARWRKICRHCPAAVVGQLPLIMPPEAA